jgi:hypothetical protein
LPVLRSQWIEHFGFKNTDWSEVSFVKLIAKLADENTRCKDCVANVKIQRDIKSRYSIICISFS